MCFAEFVPIVCVCMFAMFVSGVCVCAVFVSGVCVCLVEDG